MWSVFLCECVSVCPHSVSSSSILCLSSISSRRRLSCFWWASLWFSSCSSSVFWRKQRRRSTLETRHRLTSFDCRGFQLRTDGGDVQVHHSLPWCHHRHPVCWCPPSPSPRQTPRVSSLRTNKEDTKVFHWLHNDIFHLTGRLFVFKEFVEVERLFVLPCTDPEPAVWRAPRSERPDSPPAASSSAPCSACSQSETWSWPGAAHREDRHKHKWWWQEKREILGFGQTTGWFQTRGLAVYLRDEQLTGRQLLLIGLDLAVGVGLSALQLFAAVHQRLHLRLHLTDVETGQSELLLHRRAVPLCLWGLKEEEVLAFEC